MYSLMIVEDENKTRYSLKHYVPWSQWDVGDIFEAADGRQALELAREVAPDLVLTDIRMPDMDGIELAGRLREELPETGVIMLSAYSDVPYFKSAMKASAVDYLLKPVDMEELGKAVRAAIERMKQAEAIRRERSLLSRHLPALREQFLLSVLEGKYTQGAELEQAAVSLGFETEPGMLWCPVALRFSAESGGAASNADSANPAAAGPRSDIFRQQLASVIRHSFQRFGRLEIVACRESEWFALAVAEPGEEQEAAADAARAAALCAEAVGEHLGLGIGVELGRFAPFAELHKSMSGLKPTGITAAETMRPAVDERQEGLVRSMKAYIGDHYRDENMTVSDIAAHLNYTSAYVCMVFKKATGMTLNHYINLYRIREAKKLLCDPSLKLFDIATSVGYSNDNYFSKVFKKYESVPPSEYARGIGQ